MQIITTHFMKNLRVMFELYLQRFKQKNKQIHNFKITRKKKNMIIDLTMLILKENSYINFKNNKNFIELSYFKRLLVKLK